MNFQGASDVLYRLFSAVLEPLGTSGLVLHEGSSLLIEPSTPADLATLPHAAALCHRYLKLGDLDAALTNDPYSGGTTLSDFTLVLGVRLPPQDVELLLVKRLHFTPRLPLTGKLDDEGVRVPPTPLASAGSLNGDLLSAIQQHPMAPREFKDEIQKGFEELKSAAGILKNLARDPGTLLTKANLQRFIEDSSLAFEALLARLPLGTSLVTGQLPSGENLKLQLKITENRVSFDFAGSESSKQIGLTELATFGACFAATVASSREPIPLNTGSFHHLQVIAPQKTVLSASAPTGTYRGMTEGLAAVGRLALEALAKLQNSLKEAPSPGTNGCYQLVFSDGRVLNLETPPGQGASSGREGSIAASIWAARSRFLQSPEDIDRRFPVLTLAAGTRTGSGGSGKKSGGCGSLIALKVLETAEFRWEASAIGRKHEGLESGRSGAAAAIEILREGKEREEITEPRGSLRLSKGDQLYLLGGGGGAIGAPEEKEASE